MSNGVDAAVALAEALPVPVCTTYLHNDAFPMSNQLWMGPLGYQVSHVKPTVPRIMIGRPKNGYWAQLAG